ncbi:MAG: hypothetical protein M3R25_06860 [Bacteroidota bacterium]|nr:hypothetical protein [Bacteroidota bacterium]
MKKLLVSTITSLLLIFAYQASISAQAWAFLGASKVHGHADHDEILVTGLKGDFSAIKLMVENEGIQFDRVVVHFANGGKQELVLRDFIAAGGETRVMDLTGRDRIIRAVDFFYKSNVMTKRKGKVLLYGSR